ncbi:MAG: four helix bundle protein [Burkholderiales bacterium]|nr:four helix bundle protein [Burkholderiales bacterium]
MTSEFRSHRDLVVWQRSVEFAHHLHRLVAQFPAQEQWGIAAELRRASTAIAANVAAGAAVATPTDFIGFVNQAIASTTEVEANLEVAIRSGLVDESAAPIAELLQILRMLIRLRLSLIEKHNATVGAPAA